MNNFYIKDAYKHRKDIKHHDDRGYVDKFQNFVYHEANKLIKENNFKNVIDIGCGSGYKLMKYFNGINTLGLELEPSLTYLRGKYPSRKWILSDLDLKIEEEYDAVICADVIEHLPNPDILLKFLDNINGKYLFLSTPARELLKIRKGKNNDGPPRNKCHHREWTTEEFSKYLSNKLINWEIIKVMHNKKECSQYYIIKHR